MKRPYWFWFPFLIVFSVLHSASASKSFDPGFPPAVQSNAYKQYALRPQTELSKIVYLVDRFAEAKIKINYDGYFYDALFSSKIAKWFLARRYRGQKAKEWIFLWCDKTVPSGNLIWVVDSKENVRLAREVLIEELQVLESIPPPASEKQAAVVAALPAETMPSQLTASAPQAS